MREVGRLGNIISSRLLVGQVKIIALTGSVIPFRDNALTKASGRIYLVFTKLRKEDVSAR
jgi:hypothetical protein